MTDEPPERGSATDPAGGRAADPMSALQSLLPGLAWTQTMMEGTARAQAALAADTLRRLNAPVVEALARHREMATALADMAKQMATMARQVEELARRHAQVTEQIQAAMEPYLRYVEWLDGQGTQRPPKR